MYVNNPIMSGTEQEFAPPARSLHNRFRGAIMSDQSTSPSSARQSACKQCSKSFAPHGDNPGIYCSMKCKADWQRTQKPVDFDWLYEKYIVENRSAPEIALIVNRNAKRVWEWLRDYGIPTRKRGGIDNGHRFIKGHKLCVGRKVSLATREKIRAARILDGHVPYLKNGKHWLKGKTGPICPSWKGGITPERQSFYSSDEWQAAVKLVWRRDNATCQRCGIRNRKGERFSFDIHHIVSFAFKPLRSEAGNLVLLCEKCHYWVHSSDNVEKRFIREIPDVA